MVTREDDVEIHALARRGWSISAIARHTGHDRKTVRRYLRGEAAPWWASFWTNVRSPITTRLPNVGESL